MTTALLVPLALGTVGWFGLIIIGLVAGAIAKAILPGKDPMGWIVSLILGVVGALVGGWIGNFLGIGARGFWNPITWILAIVGCIVVLAIYGLITKKRV